MKNSRSLRLVLSRGLLASALLASPVFALSTAELDSLRAKADRGNAIAQYNLGLAYADRAGSIYDPAQAYAWLSVAAANGTNGKALSDLTGQLTPAQLAEGKNRFAALSASAGNPISAPSSPILTAAPASIAAVSSPAIDPDQKKLSAELAAAWKENELLKSGLNAQLADANKRVSIAEAALASKDRQIALLQNQLTQATAVTTPAVGVATSAELATLRAERDQLQAAASNATGELARVRAASDKSTADQAGLAAKLAQANDSLTKAQRAQSLAESEAASLRAAADRASAERLSIAAQLETATSELEKARSAPAAPQTIVKENISDTALSLLLADRDHFAESAKNLSKERDALAAQLAATKSAVPAAPEVDATARITELENAKTEADTKLEASLRSFTLQQAEIERLQKALASIDDERARTLTKLENATAELVSLRPQANSAAAVSAEAETLRTQLAEARQTVSEQAASLNTANLNLADARRTVDTATADLVATRDQLRQTQAQAAASAIEAQQLKTRLALVGNLPASNSPSRPGSVPAISINLPSATVAAPAPAPAPVRVEAPAGPRIHTVSSGDSLSRISKQYYGTAGRWNEILQANRAVISNPDSLTLGTKLRIP